MDELFAKQQRLKAVKELLRPLTETEREAAYDVARNRVAGKPVEEREYLPLQLPEPEPAEYPDWMIWVVVSLCILVLIASFVPSAYRMYMAGYTVFCTAYAEFVDPLEPIEPAPEWLCMSVGVTTVLMAEIGQTVALLAIAVLGTTASSSDALKKAANISNLIFWGVAALTTVVAFAGNLHVARPWLHAGPFFGVDVFAWILDLFPPTLVIGIMYAMKELMLYFIRRRYQYLKQIETAKADRLVEIEKDREERKFYLGSPEEHPQWLRSYSLAIKEQFSLANGRQKGERADTRSVKERLELLRSLSTDEWKHLIKTQMLESDYTVDPLQTTAVEKFQNRLEEIQQAEPELQLVEKPVIFDEKDLETVKADVWEATPGQWSFKSRLSGYVRHGLASKAAAEKALKQYEYHYNRRNS